MVGCKCLRQNEFRIRAALLLSFSSDWGQNASDPILFVNLLTGAPIFSNVLQATSKPVFSPVEPLSWVFASRDIFKLMNNVEVKIGETKRSCKLETVQREIETKGDARKMRNYERWLICSILRPYIFRFGQFSAHDDLSYAYLIWSSTRLYLQGNYAADRWAT